MFVTGPSGAGKTTLLKLLFRDEEPSEGEIVIAGQNVNKLNRRGVARLRQQMGLVFQEIKFLPGMTVLDNVALAAGWWACRAGGVIVKLDRLPRCENSASNKHDAGPLALSGGERQRVAIARALMNDPILCAGRRADGKSGSRGGGDDGCFARDPATWNDLTNRKLFLSAKDTARALLTLQHGFV